MEFDVFDDVPNERNWETRHSREQRSRVGFNQSDIAIITWGIPTRLAEHDPTAAEWVLGDPESGGQRVPVLPETVRRRWLIRSMWTDARCDKGRGIACVRPAACRAVPKFQCGKPGRGGRRELHR